jgi:hypothetical protein
MFLDIEQSEVLKPSWTAPRSQPKRIVYLFTRSCSCLSLPYLVSSPRFRGSARVTALERARARTLVAVSHNAGHTLQNNICEDLELEGGNVLPNTQDVQCSFRIGN